MLRLSSPQPICPQDSCLGVSAQPQRKVLYSTACKDCCEQKQSQTSLVPMKLSHAEKWCEHKVGRKRRAVFGRTSWLNDSSAFWQPAQLAQNLVPEVCRARVRGLWLPLGMLQPHKLWQKPRLCLAPGMILRAQVARAGRSRTHCQWFPGHSGLCPQLAAPPCVHLSGTVGRMSAGDTTFLSRSLGAGGMALFPLHIKVYSAAKLE